jgi:hypothetical protein
MRFFVKLFLTIALIFLTLKAFFQLIENLRLMSFFSIILTLFMIIITYILGKKFIDGM